MKSEHRVTVDSPVSSHIYIVAILQKIHHWYHMLYYLFDRGNNVNLSLNCALTCVPKRHHLLMWRLSYAGKHPVSALIELCNKQRILQPEFVMVHHSGPDHRKNFLFKVSLASFHLPFFSVCVHNLDISFFQNTPKSSNIKFGFTLTSQILWKHISWRHLENHTHTHYYSDGLW